MNYLSVCSGIEAATVAWHDLGWKALGYSEIEKFPSQVLAHHYPDVPNFGDMTKYKEWDFGANRLDLLVGGTPCQSFSVAGLRKGLEDPRGNLALTYVGILDKFRPKWCIWENVPGVLSSSKGRDFGSFLGALVELGYGFSYRVLDAKNFGVPQRRRRVFVVGHLGDWKPSAEVLFESESLQWNIGKSRQEREGTSTFIETSFAQYRQSEHAATTKASGGVLGGGSETFVYETHPADSRVKEMGETCQTVTSRWGTGGGNVPLVQSYGFEPGIAKREGDPSRFSEEISPTLRAQMGDNQVAMANTMAVRRLTPIECERLQGFPDNYTNIRENCPDSPRYKALGNSMAVPVMKWIGQRIMKVENER